MKRRVLVLLLAALTLTAPAGAQDAPRLVLDTGGHSAIIKEVMFTPDGRLLVSVSEDKTIRLWDTETGAPVRTLRGQIGDGPEGKLYAAALAPDGKLLAVAGYGETGGDKPIHLYDLDTAQQVGMLTGHTNVIHVLAFSPDGARLASGSSDETVRLWNVETREQEARLDGHTDNVYGVAFSPDGRRLVSASLDGTLRLWDLASGRALAVMRGHTEEVRCVAFSPDGRYIVSGGWDDRVLLWDGEGRFLKEIDNYGGDVVTVSFSNDSQRVVAVGKGSYQARVYTIPSGEKRATFSKHDNTVQASAVYGNTLVATAGGDRTSTCGRRARARCAPTSSATGSPSGRWHTARN